MREKLIDIVEYYADYLDWDTKEDMVDRIMEFIATDNNVGHKWIPVTERLPEESGDYLVITDGGFIERLSYSERHNAFNTDDRLVYAACAIPCTHWMPLPEPPKGE